MSIFHFASAPNRVRVVTYIGLPAVPVREAAWARMLRDCLETDILGRIRLIACDWPKQFPVENHGGLEGVSVKRFPVMVYCRGGIGPVGRVRREWIQDFVARGYLVVAPCYRAAESGEGTDEFGGRENDDVVSLVKGLIQLPFVDPSRITFLGFSRGSINAWQSAIRIPAVHSLILWGGVSDLSSTYLERPNMRRMLRRITGGTPSEAPDAYRSRSPIHLVDSITCPVLIVHGTADTQVDISHGLRLAKRLEQSSKVVTTHIYQALGHHVPHAVHQAVVDRMSDWVRLLGENDRMHECAGAGKQ